MKRRLTMILMMLGLGMGLVLANAQRAAAIVTVTHTADSGAGSLRGAIAAAAPGDMIDFNLQAVPARSRSHRAS